MSGVRQSNHVLHCLTPDDFTCQRRALALNGLSTLSCWPQYPFLFFGTFMSILARTSVMLAVIKQTWQSPSCMMTAPTSACWVGSHAKSKQNHHKKIPVSLWRNCRCQTITTNKQLQLTNSFKSHKIPMIL